MNHVMIDLETLGTKPGSVILSIGAVFFDPQDGLGAAFHQHISLASSLQAGMEIDADTLRWWLSDGRHEGLHRILNGTAESLGATLLALRGFLDSGADRLDKLCVWGNGAAFDISLLQNAYERCMFTIPWRFWNVRCYRTLKALYPEIPGGYTNAHDALRDARNQAEHACRILR